MLVGSREAPCPNAEDNDGFEEDDRWDHRLDPDDIAEHLRCTEAETKLARRLLAESAARWQRAMSPPLPRRVLMRHFVKKERRLQRRAELLRSRRVVRRARARARFRRRLHVRRVGAPARADGDPGPQGLPALPGQNENTMPALGNVPLTDAEKKCLDFLAEQAVRAYFSDT